MAGEVENPAVHDVVEESGLTEDARLERFEQISIAFGRQRLPMRRRPGPFVVRVTDQNGARLAVSPPHIVQ